MAGLAAARELSEHGHEVVVFDKGRAPGGRVCTRRRGELQWDHGAQCFDVKDPRMESLVSSWRDAGLVQTWHGRAVVLDRHGVRDEDPAKARLVGVPGMSALARALARGLDVRSAVTVKGLERRDGAWWLGIDGADGTCGPHDAVIVALPAPQAAKLLRTLGDDAPVWTSACDGVRMHSSLSVMLAFPERWDLPFDIAVGEDSPLAWAARDSSKPGRPDAADLWVLQSAPAWAEGMFRAPGALIAETLTHELATRGGVRAPRRVHLDVMRWRFSVPVAPLVGRALADDEEQLVVCGDWCGGARIGPALRSGWTAAERLLNVWVSGSADAGA